MTDKVFPISNPGTIHRNNSPAELYELSIERKEARLASTGALTSVTGQHTGRSAGDKFTVRDATTESNVWWDNSKSITSEQFETLYQDFLKHAEGLELFCQDLYVGAEDKYKLPTRVYSEYAWHALFIQNLMIELSPEELANFDADFTVVDLPSFKADPARHGCDTETLIAADFDRRLVLIANTSYAGEMKKSAFTFLNYTLPERGVMPMHCSVNEGDDGDTAVFFGLSGTGKTTLSADPNRTLIGDDEHGWSESGVFNFEGGCYAKMIKLSAEAEPEIYDAVNRFGAVLENVVLKGNRRVPDFDDASLTENTRGAYPLSFIPNASATGTGGHPKNIIMLTADAFGVLPPLSKLSPDQAMYHFLSGYTAKVAGTEKGVTEPTATFSTCYGAPFMPRHPSVYGNLLRELIAKHDVDCWLVNTGWTGGKYGVGHRMPIKETRALLTAALSGALADVEFRTDPIFGFEVPVAVEGVDTSILDPRGTWEDKDAYDVQAMALAGMFNDNFGIYESHVDDEVRDAAPQLRAAAE